MKLDEPEHDRLPYPDGSWEMPYSGTYLPHSSPMPFNYTSNTTCYSLTRDGSGSGNTRKLNRRLSFARSFKNLCEFDSMACDSAGGSRSGSDIVGHNVPLMKTAASGASSSGGGGSGGGLPTHNPKMKNEPNGKQRAMVGSSGSETSSNPAYSQDLSVSQQSFKMAMGNPCEFFVDVM